MNFKHSILIFFSFWVMQLNAVEKPCPTQNNILPELKPLAELAEHLEWSAASDSQVRNAHCIRKNPVTEDEMLNWLSKNQSSQNKSQKINGIQFENESPENLKSFEHLTNAVDMFGRVESNRQKQFSSQCKKVECAVSEIFGKDVGLQLLFMQRKYGLNGSQLARDNTSKWRKSELDEILLSLTDFPEGILPIQDNRPLVHFERGYMRPGGEGTVANAVIEIFDVWNKQSPEERRYTITHELGHAIAGITDLDDDKKWKDLSGWKETTRIVNGKKQTESLASNEDAIVSKYGNTNQAEDFAESVAAYRYNPKLLKEASREKYQLIKEVIFDNVEYTSEDACQNPDRLSKRLQKEIQSRINNWSPSLDDMLESAKKCTDLAITKLNSDGYLTLNSPTMKSCYKESLNQKAKSFGLEILNSYPNKKFLEPLFRNLNVEPLPPIKLDKLANSASDVHQKTLRNEFKAALKSDYHFSRETNGKNEYIYQSFSKSMGIDPFNRRKEISNIANNLSRKINATSSIRRTLRLDFSEEEIATQVDMMIR